MTVRARCVLLALVTLARILADDVAFAADGKIPIPFQIQTSTPIVIDQPGHYILTQNLTGNGMDSILSITATDVVIDLNGMVLTSPKAPSAGIELADQASATISNGSIEGGVWGIYAIGLSSLTLDGVRFAGMSAAVAAHAAAFLEVRRCKFEDIYDVAISNAGISITTVGLIEDNDFSNIGRAAVYSNGTLDVRGNRLQNVGHLPDAHYCITLRSGNVIDNVLTTSGSGGVRINGNSANVTGNVISGAGDCGIAVWFLWNDNLVRKNTVTNSRCGIVVAGSRNRIDANTLNGNREHGLYFTTDGDDNLYSANIARDNNSDAITCQGSGGDDFCDAGTGNTSSGDNWMPGQQ